MNGSQEPKIGFCLVEGFCFLRKAILYLVVFGGNILHGQYQLVKTSNGNLFHGGMAQSVEHIVHIDGVVGSSPTVTTPRIR